MSYLIPEDEPVRLLWEVLEGMDFTAYEKETATWSAQEQFALWVMGTMNGMFSSRKLEEACRNDIQYMWPLSGKRAPDHSSLSRFRQKVLPQLLPQVFPQLMRYLHGLKETDYETVYIDGTKLEAMANRYSFVWRKSVEKHLARLKEKATAFGAATAEEAAELARKRRGEMTLQGIQAVSGKGRRKHPLQREAEQLEALCAKWEEYKTKLNIIGPGRNSYAKTDHDATFMCMKDDHMRNGQLKPAYNVQLAVNSEYIVGYWVFSDRTDGGTLKPMLQTMEEQHGCKYQSVTADAGYESLESYTWLDENEQLSFIKPANYERRKKSNWIGRMEDMGYDPDTDSFTCQNGKQLTFAYKGKQKSSTGFESAYSVYRCTECTGCPLRPRCSKAEQPDTKQMKVCWDFVQRRRQRLENITSDKGILYRVNRSIQVEGALGVLKQVWDFRRFLTRGNRQCSSTSRPADLCLQQQKAACQAHEQPHRFAAF